MHQANLLLKILKNEKSNLSTYHTVGLWVPFLGIFPSDFMSKPADEVLRRAGDIWLAGDNDSIF